MKTLKEMIGDVVAGAVIFGGLMYIAVRVIEAWARGAFAAVTR